MKIALTDLKVQALKPGVYFDMKTPAFGLRVGVHRRTWIAMKGPARTIITLGHYPSISLQEARRKALLVLASPTQKNVAMTFPEALTAYMEQGKWRPSTRTVMKSTLKPFTWTRQLSKITHEDIAQALEAISAPSMRAHAFKDLRTFFNWCVPRYLSASPCVGIKMPAQPTRSRVLTDDELVKVWRAAELIGYPFGIIVMLLILTGQRRSEIGSLRWNYIHQDKITLPPEATKNGREHSFPLSPFTNRLLGLCLTSTTPSSKSSTDSPSLLFPAKNQPERPFSGWSKSHASLLKLSGTSDWTLHDLRRTFSTKMAFLKVRQEVTEKLLNHVSGSISGVAAIYNRHAYFEEMTEALALYETHLQTLLRKE